MVSRSCAKRAVLIGLPTSRRFNEAIFFAAPNFLFKGGAKNATAYAYQSGDCGAAPTQKVVPCLIYFKAITFEFIVVPYIMPLSGKVNGLLKQGNSRQKREAIFKKLEAKK